MMKRKSVVFAIALIASCVAPSLAEPDSGAKGLFKSADEESGPESEYGHPILD